MKMTLFTALNSNTSERVLWALDFKGVPYQAVDATRLKSEGVYSKISAFGYVPALQVGEHTVSESIAILEYIEECYPQPSLLPGSALERAAIREVCEFINSTIHPAQNRSILNYLRPDLEPQSMRLIRAKWLESNLKKLRALLWLQGEFAIGTCFSWADIFVAVMYKRALVQGVLPVALPEYQKHIEFLFKQDTIKEAAPFVFPIL